MNVYQVNRRKASVKKYPARILPEVCLKLSKKLTKKTIHQKKVVINITESIRKFNI